MKKFITAMALVLAVLPNADAKQKESTESAAIENKLYVKKGTWKETAIATFENYHQFKGGLYLEHLEKRSKITMSVSIAGPFTAKENDTLNVKERDDTVTVNGKSYTWRTLPDFKVRDGNDLAKMAGLKKGDCALLRINFPSDKRPRNRFGLVIAHSMAYGKLTSEAGIRNAPIKKFPMNTPFLHPNMLKATKPAMVWAKANKNRLYTPVKVSDDGTCLVSITPSDNGIASGNGAPLPYPDMPQRLYNRIMKDFSDTTSQVEMRLEFFDAIWDSAPGAEANKYAKSWFTGRSEEFLTWHYNKSVETMVAEAPEQVNSLPAAIGENYIDHLKRVEKIGNATYQEALERFQLAKFAELILREYIAATNTIEAVSDQIATYGDSYSKGKSNLKQLEKQKDKIGAVISGLQPDTSVVSLTEVASDLLFGTKQMCDDILIQNPALGSTLLMTKGTIKPTPNWTSNDAYGKELVTFNPVNPKETERTIYTSEKSINSIDLDWDAEKILVCDNKNIIDIRADGTGEPQLIKTGDQYLHDACRLPDGRVIFSSTTIEQAVPCTGGANVGNFHIIDPDGSNQRRICYDQDHNWHPTVMENGRVMFLRWEYTGQVHYFSRVLMTMNPDGTGQVAHYGSNSYWPNSIFWPRQLPGQSSKFVGLVTGHHGVKKQGHPYLFDVAKGRFEADGVIQKLGARGKETVPVIADRLVDGQYPHYMSPYPLGTNAQESGKYFLATGKMSAGDGWALYLLDIYDNKTLIARGDYSNARPLQKRKKPPVIPDRVDTSKKTATVLISDIHFGPGLKGVKRGTVKSLRLATPIYRYAKNGDTFASAFQGGWDIKKILGTVPVEEDGSASFEIPANMPIIVQPLNAEGQSMQIMRSWFTAMPGETVSCIGCHEDQNTAPPQKPSLAMRRAPHKLTPWYGEARGISFKREVQPVLDRKCVGCHDGSEKKTRSGLSMPDFRASGEMPDKKYSKAYIELQKYVRRAGVEPDAHLARPTEWMADTSHLVKMLKKGHHNVVLNKEEWERIYTWIDLNIPYPGNWNESHRPPTTEQVARRVKYLKAYADIDERIEESLPMPDPVEFVKPGSAPKQAAKPVVSGWPIEPQNARQMQADCGLKSKSVDLGNNVSMELVPVPAGSYIMGDGGMYHDEAPKAVTIEAPFYMSSTEVTFAQYQLFDGEHENGFIDGRGKDRTTRGVCDMNKADYPVVRITQERALAFCQWLSKKTGLKVTLPTEQQWEWAARAGSGGAHYLSDKEQAKGYNIADKMNAKWNHGRYQDGHDDGELWVTSAKSFTPNVWGLYNMLGNVAEWTASDYTPIAEIGVTKEVQGQIDYVAVRGGSWNDTASFATLSSRWRYMPSQPVNDVGFRVVIEK